MDEKRSTNQEPEAQGTFKKEIGVFGGVSIIGGIMIGSGIFYIGSTVLQRTNMSLGAALLCWVIGGLVSLLGGMCFAELGASDPLAGGKTIYLSKAFHPFMGFADGFCAWLVSNPASIAGVAIALPTALLSFFDISDFAIKGIAIGLIVLLSIFNCFGVKQGSMFQNITMVAKVIPLFIIIIGALIFGRETPDLSIAIVDANGDPAGLGAALGMIGFAVVAALWAYEGWVNLNLVAEEIKNPKRNLPLAIIIAIGGITLLYTLFNFSIYRMIPYDEIVSRINAGDLYLGTEVVNRLMGTFGGTFVTLAMVLAMLNCLNGMIMSFPRTYYAMGRGGHFFKSQGTLHPKYGTPVVAIFWQAVVAIILVIFQSLSQLTSMVVFVGMMFNLATVIAVLRYRKLFPDLERPYKVPGGVVTVLITSVLFAALAINSLLEDPVSAIVGFGALGISGVLYYLFGKRNEKQAAQGKK